MDILFIIYGGYLCLYAAFSMAVGFVYFFDIQKMGILNWCLIFIPPLNSFRVTRAGHPIAYWMYILIYLGGGGALIYYHV